MTRLTKHFFVASLSVFAMAGIFYGVVGATESAFTAMLAGLVLLSLAMKQHLLLKELIFSIWILAGVVLALVMPDQVLTIRGVETRHFILPLLMLIMFGMGCTIKASDFVNILKMPKGVLIGLACQFSIMPCIGFALAVFSGLPAEIAAGIILVGCSPSGLASNVMCFIAKANVALSLTLTTIATLVAPLLTPLLMKLLANQFIEIDAYAMFLKMLQLVVFPVGLGLLVSQLLARYAEMLKTIMPAISMAGIVVIISIICAAGSNAILDIGPLLVIIVATHNLLGFALGYGAAKVAGMEERDARTISFEVGMQNSGLASGIAMTMNKIATMGLAPAFFSPFMNITGSTLASWWGKSKAD